MKKIHIYVVIVVLVVLLGYNFGIPFENFEGYVFVILLIGFGIPHGALDHKILFTQGWFHYKQKMRFYLKYIGLMMFMGCFWYFLPYFAFVFFMIISAYHFGQSQLYYLQLTKAIATLMYTAWGILLLSTIVFFNQAECLLFFTSLDGLSVAPYINDVVMISLMAVSGCILTSLLVYSFISGRISRTQLGYECIVLMLIALLAVRTSAVMSFSLYFGLWHSFVSLVLEYKHLKRHNVNLDLWKFSKQLLPHTLAALVFLGAFYLLSPYYNMDISPYMLFIVLISIITVPHLFVMSNLYNLLSKNYV